MRLSIRMAYGCHKASDAQMQGGGEFGEHSEIQ